jgi:two-component system KDP operon response regulator KdpE
LSLHRPRILVIDDEPQIHRFLTPALEASGYEPAQALTGAAGLRDLAAHPSDAVILDLGLPDMDGKDLLLRARSFYQGPIIILSARDRELEKIAALDAGADDYVEKPFGVGELLARLRVALRRDPRRAEAPMRIQTGDLEIDLDLRLVRGRRCAAVPQGVRAPGPAGRGRRPGGHPSPASDGGLGPSPRT